MKALLSRWCSLSAVKTSAVALAALGLAGCDGATVTIEPHQSSSVTEQLSSSIHPTVSSTSSSEVVVTSSASPTSSGIEVVRTYYPSWHFNITDMAVDAVAGHAYIVDKDLDFIFKVDVVTGDLLAELPLPFTAGAVAFSGPAATIVATSNDGTHRAKVFNANLMVATNEIALGFDAFDVVVHETGFAVFSSSDESQPFLSSVYISGSSISSIELPVNSYLAASQDYIYSTSLAEPNTYRKHAIVKGTVLENEAPYREGSNIGEWLTMSPDGNHFLTAQGDYFNRQDDRLTSMGPEAVALRDIAFTPNSDLALTIGQDGLIRLYDMEPNFNIEGDLLSPRMLSDVSVVGQAEHVLSLKQGEFVIHSVKGLAVSQLDISPFKVVSSSSASVVASSSTPVTSAQSTSSESIAVSSAATNNSSVAGSSVGDASTTSHSVSVSSTYGSSSIPVTSAQSTSSFAPISSSSSSVVVSSSSYSSLNYSPYPETPNRINLSYNVTTNWDFSMDDFASDSTTGIAFAIDNEKSTLYKLDLLDGQLLNSVDVPEGPIAISYLKGYRLVVVASRDFATLNIYNTEDLSLVDTVQLDDVPYDLAVTNAGYAVLSFSTGAEKALVYDLAAGALQDEIAMPLESKLTIISNNQLFAISNDRFNLWRFSVNNQGIALLEKSLFDDDVLGDFVSDSRSSDILITAKGTLFNKDAFTIADTIDYGQLYFKDIQFLKNSDYAISLDDRNYIRLFDARVNSLDYGVTNDPRRIGSNSSLGSAERIVPIKNSAVVIHRQSFTSNDTGKYSIVALDLLPYLNDEGILNSSSSSVVVSSSSSVGNQSTSSEVVVISSSTGVDFSSSSLPYNVLTLSERPVWGDSTQELGDTIVDHQRGLMYLFGQGISFDAIDIHSGERVWGWATRDNIQGLAISPDGSALYAAYAYSETVFIFDLETQELTDQLYIDELERGEFLADIVVNDGFIILSIESSKPRLMVYDRNSLDFVSQLDVAAPVKIEGVNSQEGILASYIDNNIQKILYFYIRGGFLFEGAPFSVEGFSDKLEVSPDGDFVVSHNNEVISLFSGEPYNLPLSASRKGFYDVALDKNTSRIAVIDLTGKVVEYASAAVDSELHQYHLPHSPEQIFYMDSELFAIVALPDGRRHIIQLANTLAGINSPANFYEKFNNDNGAYIYVPFTMSNYLDEWPALTISFDFVTPEENFDYPVAIEPVCGNGECSVPEGYKIIVEPGIERTRVIFHLATHYPSIDPSEITGLVIRTTDPGPYEFSIENAEWRNDITQGCAGSNRFAGDVVGDGIDLYISGNSNEITVDASYGASSLSSSTASSSSSVQSSSSVAPAPNDLNGTIDIHTDYLETIEQSTYGYICAY
ncbi:hypothetical protein MARGE09_P3813 [Marinagarivorans cellulosilyticus]|uniref:Uncharacterized protein n=2 Tax=Marinagarivorans cellulosilyticus TaxID=2721545 RepID=A0AAN1WL49_9GAMM|nr:hypothetical protein MARGE09_P3813 [Marinagarivorans cellulosilyticus]